MYQCPITAVSVCESDGSSGAFWSVALDELCGLEGLGCFPFVGGHGGGGRKG